MGAAMVAGAPIGRAPGLTYTALLPDSGHGPTQYLLASSIPFRHLRALSQDQASADCVAVGMQALRRYTMNGPCASRIALTAGRACNRVPG